MRTTRIWSKDHVGHTLLVRATDLDGGMEAPLHYLDSYGSRAPATGPTKEPSRPRCCSIHPA
jgi:hypothetical protein